MTARKLYSLPKLPYDNSDLAPYISAEQLTLHHQKHHQAYVNGANALLEKMVKAREAGQDLDQKAVTKELSFHIGGFRLHNLFWENMAPAKKGGGGEPKGALLDTITGEFGSVDRFKKEFTQTANSAEGSGWAALVFCRMLQRPIIMQIEKHNVNVIPSFQILMVLDVWEHAYYLDYRNDRAKFVEGFWNIVNWNEIGKRLEPLLQK
ncbi:MAG: superoxide dismutase [Methanoregulaceae archaeon]